MLASLRNLLWPRQRRRQPAAAMGTLSLIPEDVLTTRVACYFPSRDEYLSLRAASKGMLGLTQRAIASGSSIRYGVPTVCDFGVMELSREEKEAVELCREMKASARHVAAMASVFGAGCRALRSAGRAKESLAALEHFVTSTNGGLTALNLRSSKVLPEMLLRMCRASPKLTSLLGPKVYVPESTIVAISEACPYLEVVDFASIRYSPAETWARHFPRLKTIVCGNGYRCDYQPTRIDNIRMTALATRASKLDVEACHITREVIDAIVGTPLGDRIETLGEAYDCNPTNLEPEALLAAARGFPRLTELWVPEGSTMGGPQFYTQLARAAPRLRTLHIWDNSTTAACVAAACDMRLEHLHLDSFYDHGDRHVVEAIIGSQASETLVELNLHYIDGRDCELFPRAADVLRVVQGCPKLKRLSWWVQDRLEESELEPETCRAISELLVSRGGFVHTQPGPSNNWLPEHGPIFDHCP